MADAFESLSRWGAVLGLIPTQDLFHRFQEQKKPLFRQPLFWWFLIVFVFQVVQGVACEVFQYLNYRLGLFSNLPVVTTVSGFAVVGIYGGFSLMPRLVFINGDRLTAAFRKLKQFDFLFQDQQDSARDAILRKKLRRFLLLGAVWIILYTVGIGIPGLISFAKVQSIRNLLIFGSLSIFQLVGLLHVIIAFAMFYVGKLSLALRLEGISKAFRKVVPTYAEIASSKITRDEAHIIRHGFTLKARGNKPRFDDLDTTITRNLDHIKLCFSVLFEASTSFNQAFWFTTFLCLGCKLFLFTMTLYILVYTILTWPPIGPVEVVTHSLIMFLSNLSFFLTILLTADAPVVQWRNLMTVVSQCRTTDLSSEEKTEIQLFSDQISNSSFALSAAGMFDIGKHLIPGVCASALTYLIVLLQSSTRTETWGSDVNATQGPATSE